MAKLYKIIKEVGLVFVREVPVELVQQYSGYIVEYPVVK